MADFCIIRPMAILPIPIPHILAIEFSMWFLYFVGFVLFAFLICLLIEKHKINLQKKSTGIYLILTIIASAIPFLRFGIGMESIKGFILFELLLFASYSDLRTREVSNSIPIMITITALIDVNITDIPIMVFAAICVTAPQMLVAALHANCHSENYSYGGGDIKLMAACSFLLGLERGFAAIIAGLSLCLIVMTVTRLIQKKEINKEAFPVVPYLAIGSFLAFII